MNTTLPPDSVALLSSIHAGFEWIRTHPEALVEALVGTGAEGLKSALKMDGFSEQAATAILDQQLRGLLGNPRDAAD